MSISTRTSSQRVQRDLVDGTSAAFRTIHVWLPNPGKTLPLLNAPEPRAPCFQLTRSDRDVSVSIDSQSSFIEDPESGFPETVAVTSVPKRRSVRYHSFADQLELAGPMYARL
jgi:hypothetical protein